MDAKDFVQWYYGLTTEDDTLHITNGAVDDYYANGDDFVEIKALVYHNF